MFASRGPCGLDAIGIFLAVTESERVFLDNRRGQDVAASFVKDMLETCLGADAPVMIAFGADRQVVLPFLEENHLSAISAFMPEIVACRFLLGNERSEEHTSELQSLMRISYAVFCLKKKKKYTRITGQSSTVVITN